MNTATASVRALHRRRDLLASTPGLIPSILALNVADAVFTVGYVTAGLADEANPLMATLMALHPAAFVAGKLGLTILGTTLLWRYRDRRMAQWGLLGLFVIYYLLLLFHMNGQHVSSETAALLWG